MFLIGWPRFMFCLSKEIELIEKKNEYLLSVFVYLSG